MADEKQPEQEQPVPTEPEQTKEPEQNEQPVQEDDISKYLEDLEKSIEKETKEQQEKLKKELEDQMSQQDILENPRLRDLAKGLIKKSKENEQELRNKVTELEERLKTLSSGSKSPDSTPNQNPYEEPPKRDNSKGPTTEEIKADLKRRGIID